MINDTLIEDGNGGALFIKNNDIQQTDSLYTLVYLALFGGNVEENTVKDIVTGELNFDWWGNDKNEPAENWVNSETEKLLRNIALTSRTRFDIIQAVKNDTKKLEKFGKIEIEVTYPEINRVEIIVTIREPNVKESNRLILIWDNTKREIIEKTVI